MQCHPYARYASNRRPNIAVPRVISEVSYVQLCHSKLQQLTDLQLALCNAPMTTKGYVEDKAILKLMQQSMLGVVEYKTPKDP